MSEAEGEEQQQFLTASVETHRLVAPNTKNIYPDIRPYCDNAARGHTHGYINGSHCRGPSDRPYLLMTMPTNETIEATWEVLVQQDIHQVFTLDRLAERTWEKGDKRWEVVQRKPLIQGIYVVYHKNRETGYTVQRVVVSNWKDHQAPPPCIFRILAQTSMQPVAIHCKAGCGRTGTLVCAFELYRNPKLPLSSLISFMRQQRMWLVATQKQYDFLLHLKQLLEQMHTDR